MTINFEAIYHEFDSSLRRFIVNRVADRDLAEDILQEVYLKIHQHIDSLDDDRKLRAWVYQITRHTIIDHYRARKEVDILPETIALPETPEELNMATDLIPTVRRFINCLGEKYRQPLIMAAYQGLSQQEIAARLGLSLPGAKSRVQRARKQLKDLLLACCHFEFDRLGKIIDYCSRCSRC